jgi:hypothetical protein
MKKVLMRLCASEIIDDDLRINEGGVRGIRVGDRSCH